MQSIANLIHDDPYLTMPPAERIALRRQRREKLRSIHIEQAKPVRLSFVAPVPEPSPVRITHLEIIAEWIERQKSIAIPVVIQCLPAPGALPPKILVGDIQRAVSSHYAIPVRALFGVSRVARIVLPRQVACYLVRVLTSHSMPDIGRRFGGRDHTTVLHAVRKVQRMMAFDAEFKRGVDSLRAKIEENFI